METAAEEVLVNNNTPNNVTQAAANNNNNNNTLLKGKRTKRLRVQSPIPFCALATTTTHSSTTAEGGAENNSYAIVKCSTNVTPTTSNEYSVDNEEEDLANCLILLAQGHFGDSQNTNNTNNTNNNSNNSLALDLHNNKFNSRRFMETGSTSNGKVGYYVYECKTCNRTFPSFQALGGHRASHKKPKALQIERQALTFSSDEEDGHGYNSALGHGHYKNINMSPLSLQLSTNSHSYSPHHYNHHTNNNNNNNHKGKIHECSICGAEFTSGQALGGHMRRHRAPMASSSTNLTLSTMAISESHGHVHDQPKKRGNLLSLDLDLNLPAPEDDNKLAVNSKQLQEKKQQQQKTPLNVFSSPALVDCHY